MEKQRSHLVQIPPFRAGILKASGSIVRWLLVGVNTQRERICPRAKHRLDEPTWLSLGAVTSLHCPLPFHLAS
jgi:hypothetical protein